ncbi:uncharacterized protein [Dermacentor albipictus]|uniref:uncharacterized protein n=1 Tax=Dermacentor albipictus TaxID=60249 RepID=UPI0031FBFC86
MSVTGIVDGPCQPRALTKRSSGNADWKAGPATRHQMPCYEDGRRHSPARVEMLRNLDAVPYTDHGLRSEVDRLLRLPLLMGLPSGPVFRGTPRLGTYVPRHRTCFTPPGPVFRGSQVTPVSEAPATSQAAVNAPQRLSRTASGAPTRMATSSSLGQPSAPSFDGCAFCRTNGERRSFYLNHTLREDSGPGLRGRVTCPVLRNYQCPQCGCPGGDEAHTLRYCPLNRDYLPPSVYKTPRKSNGQPRRRPRGPQPRR